MTFFILPQKVVDTFFKEPPEKWGMTSKSVNRQIKDAEKFKETIKMKNRILKSMNLYGVIILAMLLLTGCSSLQHGSISATAVEETPPEWLFHTIVGTESDIKGQSLNKLPVTSPPSLLTISGEGVWLS